MKCLKFWRQHDRTNPIDPMRNSMHRVYVENVLEETMNYYDDKEEGALTFEQIVPGKYYRYNRDYGICEIMESASNKPKVLRYLNRDGGLLGGNGDLFEVDMTDRLLAVLKKRRDKEMAFIDEMRTW